MNPKTLGYRTDLMFARFDSEVIELPDYWVIRTPANPNFYWGNFLLFKQPPSSGDYPRWTDAFQREIGRPPATEHMTFGWDTSGGETGDVEDFIAGGFMLLESVVLAAEAVHPPAKYNHEVEIRPLREEWEWQAAFENQVALREPVHEEQGYRRFKERQFQRYRRMTEAGLGEWFGAFLGRQMVADLGLYHDGDVGRFQNVETRVEYRRQGICGALVYSAARYGFERMGVRRLVMVADENYHAARIYESVGFCPAEYQRGLEKF